MISKLKRNQRGAVPISVIIIIVLAIIGGGAYYFFGKQNEKSSTQNSTAATETQAKAVDSACKNHFGDDDFCRFAGNWAKLTDAVITMTTPDEEGFAITLTYDGAGNSHIAMTQNGEALNESIEIGDTSYSRSIGEASWTKSTGDDSDTFSEDIDFGFDFSEDSTESIQKLGKEACGNLTCFKYRLLDSSLPNTETTVWFDDKEFKLRRMTSTDPEGTTEFIVRYESVPTITEPSPVVEW